jgi:hypothetical protein
MKHTKLLIAVTLITVAFPFCKKDKTDAPTIVGFWSGKYGGTTTYPAFGYSILFRSNGTVRVFDGADTTSLAAHAKAEGSYTVSGSTVTTTYVYPSGITYGTTGVVDAKLTFLEGIWGPASDPTASGRFFVNKK